MAPDEWLQYTSLRLESIGGSTKVGRSGGDGMVRIAVIRFAFLQLMGKHRQQIRLAAGIIDLRSSAPMQDKFPRRVGRCPPGADNKDAVFG